MFAALHGLYWFCAELSEQRRCSCWRSTTPIAPTRRRCGSSLIWRPASRACRWPSCWRAAPRRAGRRPGPASALTSSSTRPLRLCPRAALPGRLRRSGARAPRRRRRRSSSPRAIAPRRATRSCSASCARRCRPTGVAADGSRGAHGRAARTAQHRPLEPHPGRVGSHPTRAGWFRRPALLGPGSRAPARGGARRAGPLAGGTSLADSLVEFGVLASSGAAGVRPSGRQNRDPGGSAGRYRARSFTPARRGCWHDEGAAGRGGLRPSDAGGARGRRWVVDQLLRTARAGAR